MVACAVVGLLAVCSHVPCGVSDGVERVQFSRFVQEDYQPEVVPVILVPECKGPIQYVRDWFSN